ncbi:hypothetical protein RCOM_0549780 [Ricinus communis]|uniref:DM2 domain-containing protein n=1 Tax=Ricinus communis TaxID=3988 RepID=B9T219_RICCO|nr:hypothetical protein RCOM_0549780 [Ricinus communis]
MKVELTPALCWNGRCLRSFHPSVADGVESKCVSLGFRNKAEYEVWTTLQFPFFSVKIVSISNISALLVADWDLLPDFLVKRLDEKAPYKLIWEDHMLLSGKGTWQFTGSHLPGSIDVNDKQIEQRNSKPPPLYLWSRLDWIAKHMAIARQCGHMSNQHEVSVME